MPIPLPPLPQPSRTKEAVQRAENKAEFAMQVLEEVAADPEVKASSRVAAANSILDRALGKPTTIVETTINFNSVIDQLQRAQGQIIDVTPEDS